MTDIKLLLAEDERRMAEALCELFRQEGYDVDLASDGESALSLLESGIYDAAVLDVMMPKMNGFTVASKARKEGITTPILMLTAKGEVDDKVAGLDSGANDYLTKPFMTEELLARLRALTRRNAGYREGVLSYGDIILTPSSTELKCRTTEQTVRSAVISIAFFLQKN